MSAAGGESRDGGSGHGAAGEPARGGADAAPGRLDKLEEIAMFTEQELSETRVQMGEVFARIAGLLRRMEALESRMNSAAAENESGDGE
ncbi:hypothetical protein BH11PLA1_BH11PLA1_02200 [soil metagenome]